MATYVSWDKKLNAITCPRCGSTTGVAHFSNSGVFVQCAVCGFCGPRVDWQRLDDAIDAFEVPHATPTAEGITIRLTPSQISHIKYALMDTAGRLEAEGTQSAAMLDAMRETLCKIIGDTKGAQE